MTPNQQTVERYMEAFRRSDHEAVLACLTDDVEWVIPGAFHGIGKEAFDREIENDAFQGKPVIELTRSVEENDVVVSEGSVQSRLRGGAPFRAVFCDVFEMRGGLIRKLTSYVVPLK